MKKQIIYCFATLLFAAVLLGSCKKDEGYEPPTIDLAVTLDGIAIQTPDDELTAETGARVDYVFTIKANTTIAQVRTINSTIINAQVKTVDETITMGFTDKTSDVVLGTKYVGTIGTEVMIVVTDSFGNEAARSLTVYPQD